MTKRAKISLLNGGLFVAAAMALHVAAFFVLGSFWPGSVYLTTAAMGFALGALAWWQFQELFGGKFWPVLGVMIVLTLIAGAILMALRLETAVCLIIGLPLYGPCAAVGIYAARHWQNRHGSGGKTRVVLLGLPLLMVPVEGQIAYPQRDAVVTSVIEIAAPPASVWAQTLEISPIGPDERIWTLSHHGLGAPQPVSAKLSGDRRALEWTKGVQFTEIITARDEPRHLAWDFAFDAPETLAAFDPHVSPDSPRLRLTTGDYLLEPTATGTRLTLQSRYTLRTPVNGYLTLWGEVFLQDFHRSVLAVIKERSEKDLSL